MGCKDIGPFILSRLSTPTCNEMRGVSPMGARKGLQFSSLEICQICVNKQLYSSTESSIII